MTENATRDYHEIEAELKKRVEGDIHFDRTSRLLVRLALRHVPEMQRQSVFMIPCPWIRT